MHSPCPGEWRRREKEEGHRTRMLFEREKKRKEKVRKGRLYISLTRTTLAPNKRKLKKKKNFTISTSIRAIIQITTSHVAVRSSPLCVAFTSIMLLCHFSTMLLLLSCTVPSATVPRTTQRFFRRSNNGSRARSVPTAVVRTLRWWW